MWVLDVLEHHRQAPPDPPALPPPAGDIADMDMQGRRAAVELALRVYGRSAARDMWARVGLPPVRSTAQISDDPLAEPLRQWLIGKTMVLAHEAAAAMGIAQPTLADLHRMALLIKRMGWFRIQARVEGKKENTWRAPWGDAWNGVVVEDAA